MRERKPYDLDTYGRQTRSGPCFICEFLRGNPAYPHHTVHEDEFAVAFLSRAPNKEGKNLTTAYGYTLVVPREHREQLMDLSEGEYLHLQRVVYRVARALREEVPTERTYVLSLGSNAGNSHLHWHVVSLPPGVPYGEQQFHFLMSENGVVELTDAELTDLAERLRQRMAARTAGEA